MEKEKLSAKEAALIDAARRGIGARQGGDPAAEQLGAAERIARLMEAERAETERRKKKLKRYGIVLPAAILAIAALLVLRAFSKR